MYRSGDNLPTRKGRFGLLSVFEAVTSLAVVLGVAAQVPRPALGLAIRTGPALVLFSLLLALLPLLSISVVLMALTWVLPADEAHRSPSKRLRRWAPHRLLYHALGAEPPSFRIAIPLAVGSTLLVTILWPFLREFGLSFAVWPSLGTSYMWRLLEGIPRLMTDSSYQFRLIRWELWSMLRWWLLFSAWTTAWIAFSSSVGTRWREESAAATLRRLLAFAPWFVVLEIAFLVGVWTDSSTTVPEPSTGFVEGIFSWDLWHWDCWQGRTWVNRGLLPTWFVAMIFARGVLRWRWSVSMAVAACIVPIALILSVAWSVAYIQGISG